MSSKWRRGAAPATSLTTAATFPREWLADAVFEIVGQFGGGQVTKPRRIEGHWQQGVRVYRDNLVRLVIDVPDTLKNRNWMKGFKKRWKAKLEQLELWMVSYVVTI